MKYCVKCCQPDSRPQVVFDDEGVCAACRWEEQKRNINWQAREQELQELAVWAKKEGHRRNTYDAALGVSGGKDSTFTALYAKQRLGLNCLLVNAAPEHITEVGRMNLENLIGWGFDCITIAVNPLIQKKLMRRDFFRYGQIRKSSEYPLWASVYTVAKEKNIPLVIQGENAALTLGVSKNMNADGDASTVWKTNTLEGKSPFDEFADTVKPKNIMLYKFPDLGRWQGKAIWLNYYAREWSQFGNAQFAQRNGLKIRTERPEELGRLHQHSCLDSDFHPVNQMLKYVKFGFGFATDEACYDIREKRLSREKAWGMIAAYDGKCGWRYIKKFCKWIDITEVEFMDNLERWRNKELFTLVNGQWVLNTWLEPQKYGLSFSPAERALLAELSQGRV